MKCESSLANSSAITKAYKYGFDKSIISVLLTKSLLRYEHRQVNFFSLTNLDSTEVREFLWTVVRKETSNLVDKRENAFCYNKSISLVALSLKYEPKKGFEVEKFESLMRKPI